MKECRIQLKDGEKEAELNINYKENNEIVIIDGIFKFFGINIDYEELAKKQITIEKMYSSFYEDKTNSATPSGSTEFAETNESDFKVLAAETPAPYTAGKDTHKKGERPTVQIGENAGIRIKNGTKRYRCNYMCPVCKHAGNHYIPEGAKAVSCHNCSERMPTHKANPDFTPDENFNYYLAGLKAKKNI